MFESGAIADVLLRRDQAAQKALEGITLKSLVEEHSATVLQFPVSDTEGNPVKPEQMGR